MPFEKSVAEAIFPADRNLQGNIPDEGVDNPAESVLEWLEVLQEYADKQQDAERPCIHPVLDAQQDNAQQLDDLAYALRFEGLGLVGADEYELVEHRKEALFVVELLLAAFDAG